MLNLKSIVHIILSEYELPWDGTHGVSHWARVLENGLRLAEETGADIDVVRLFAIFHDSQRINEGTDNGTGVVYELAASPRQIVQAIGRSLPSAPMKPVVIAQDGMTEADITIQTCWDSDRLLTLGGLRD